MTKTEMVDILYKADKGTKTELKKLSPDELEVKVAELNLDAETDAENLEENAEVSGDVEDTEPTVEPEQGTESEPDGLEVLSEVKHQLNIFTEFIYNTKRKGAKVSVENLGNGDVYVTDDGVAKVGNKDQRLLKGEKVVLDTSLVSIMSASQPEIKISELK